MTVIIKESLIRVQFSLSAPIKYSCGRSLYEKVSQLIWLVRRGVSPECRGRNSADDNFLSWLHFARGFLHGTVWVGRGACVLACMALC
jgi:hypothetical protein